jgi:hypothetical protein
MPPGLLVGLRLYLKRLETQALFSWLQGSALQAALYAVGTFFTKKITRKPWLVWYSKALLYSQTLHTSLHVRWPQSYGSRHMRGARRLQQTKADDDACMRQREIYCSMSLCTRVDSVLVDPGSSNVPSCSRAHAPQCIQRMAVHCKTHAPNPGLTSSRFPAASRMQKLSQAR